MHINAGDTAWMLTSTALVFFMMPGLALFYGGLVGTKNVIATMVQTFVAARWCTNWRVPRRSPLLST